MSSRLATHAEAVYIARSLNLNIEAVWEVIRRIEFTSYGDMESAVHDHFSRLNHHGCVREHH